MSDEAEEVSRETKVTESMDTLAFTVSERFTEPYLLSEALGEQLGENRSSLNLLVIAIHAILLDSGFVLYDPFSGLQIDRFQLPDELPSPFSISYSLPRLFRVNDDSVPNFTDHVVLKFQTLSQFFQVYGSLANGGSGLYRLSLDVYRFAPTLDLLWAHYFKNENATDYNNGSINLFPKNEVLKLWKIVKDELALPLLIDLSYSSSLSLPACLISLPPDLKLKIIESLAATDIARVGCVCSELRSVASNNELWKKKVEEEFGDWIGGRRNWKKMFYSCWRSRKKRKLREVPRSQGFRRVRRPFRPFPGTVRRAAPNPHGAVYVNYHDGYNTIYQYLGNAVQNNA